MRILIVHPRIPAGVSADAEIVDALNGSAAEAADEGVTIAADQRIGDSLGAGGAIELGALLFFRHQWI
jgi:fermentation-respiration switch protein FrsA (DUF1100 family)